MVGLSSWLGLVSFVDSVIVINVPTMISICRRCNSKIWACTNDIHTNVTEFGEMVPARGDWDLLTLLFLLISYLQLNHFPGSFQIGRKDRLWRNVSKMQLRFGKKEFNFLPQSFILPQDIKLLRKAWEDCAGRQKWIVKPVRVQIWSDSMARAHCFSFLLWSNYSMWLPAYPSMQTSAPHSV